MIFPDLYEMPWDMDSWSGVDDGECLLFAVEYPHRIRQRNANLHDHWTVVPYRKAEDDLLYCIFRRRAVRSAP